MKTKYIAGAIMAILLLGAGTVLLARAQMTGPGFGFGGHHGGAFLSHLSRKFDLTAAQQEEVKQLWQAEKPTVMPLVQQLAEGHKQMVAATANGNFDQAKVSNIASKQAQVLTQLLVEKEKLTARFYTILTPEQRLKFDSMRQQQLSHIDQFVQRMAAGQSQ